MRFRKLRIAWSVTCAIACVLLIALWMRNNHGNRDRAFVLGTLCSSTEGSVLIEKEDYPPVVQMQMDLAHMDGNIGIDFHRVPAVLGFGVDWHSRSKWTILLPQWFVVLLSVILSAVPWIPWRLVFVAPLSAALAAVAPWLKWRFSVRTLLISTTLLAVVLGLMMWSLR